MAATTYEQELMFTHALSITRPHGTNAAGRSNADADEIARRTWQRFAGTGEITYTDARTAALRAIRARETGRSITSHPDGTGAPLARDYPNAPWIRRQTSNYEYRVVVRGEGNDEHFEMMVFVRSKTRLSGEEIEARAFRAFRRGEGAYLNYPTEVGRLGPAPTLNYEVIAASHNPAVGR